MKITYRSFLVFILSLYTFSSCSSEHLEDILDITIEEQDNDSINSFTKLDYYFRLYQGGKSTQGGAIYDDFLFQASTSSELHVYNFEEKKYITTIKLPDFGHADTICFGVEKVKDDDQFPVLYISGPNVNRPGDNGFIYVYRIFRKIGEHDVEDWKGELIQRIKTPDVSFVGYFPDIVIDNKNNCMWMMGWFSQIEYNYNDGSGCTNVFSKFQIPSITDGIKDKNGVYQFTMTDESRLSYFMTYDIHAVQQGLCFYNGMIICPYGKPSVNYKGIDFIDVEKQQVISNINLAGSILYEAEAAIVVNNELYILGQKDFVFKCKGLNMLVLVDK